MSSPVSSSSSPSSLASRFTRFGRSHHGFRIGYRAASISCAVSLAWCLVALWRRSSADTSSPLAGEAVIGATLSVVILLFAGLALRIARGRESRRIGYRRGMLRGALTALAREAEVATGFVASLIAGAAVASSPAACEGIAGWFAPALGLQGDGCATATMVIVAAIGTVTTELARRQISRSLDRA